MARNEKAITSVTLTDSVENHLRQALLDGRWNDRIPAIRVIAAELGVSASTVSAALGRLKKEGLVSSVTSRSRLRPSANVRQGRVGGDGLKRITFLTHTPLHSASPVINDVYRELVKRLPAAKVRHRDCPFLGRNHVPMKIKRMIREERPDFLIVVSGTPAIAMWARECGIPVLFFGGDPGASGLPFLGVSSEEMLNEALERLSRA